MARSVVGEWARDKLDRLGKYLHAYTEIMKTQEWCTGFYYIDAFAGPGQHEIRKKVTTSPLIDVAGFGLEQEEQRQFLDGSPRVALDIRHPFTGYVFVELSSDRVDDLNALKAEYAGRREIRVRQEDCNSYLLNSVVNNQRIDWRSSRAVVFLDPFGMQVPWSTIEALGGTEAIEIFLNFPVGMAIQRLLPRDTGKLTPSRKSMLDAYFGSPEWFDVIYKKQENLFGEEMDVKFEQSSERLVKWYRDRLKKAFGFASKAALIRNSRNGPLYYLILATPNKTGVKIANDVLGAGESVG